MIGNSGSGKSTTARRLAEILGTEHIELDALYHQANWTPLSRGEFRRVLTGRLDAASDGWVVCGGYQSMIGDLVQGGADTIVWVRPPRWRNMYQVVSRTVWRLIRHEELWNGNRERWTAMLRRDPEENIVLWTWRKHPEYDTEFEACRTDGSWAHATVIVLRTRRSVREFLTRVQFQSQP